MMRNLNTSNPERTRATERHPPSPSDQRPSSSQPDLVLDVPILRPTARTIRRPADGIIVPVSPLGCDPLNGRPPDSNRIPVGSSGADSDLVVGRLGSANAFLSLWPSDLERRLLGLEPEVSQKMARSPGHRAGRRSKFRTTSGSGRRSRPKFGATARPGPMSRSNVGTPSGSSPRSRSKLGTMSCLGPSQVVPHSDGLPARAQQVVPNVGRLPARDQYVDPM